MDFVHAIPALAVYLGLIFGGLAIGCFLADRVVMRIKPLKRWVDNLPEFRDDDE